MRILLIKGQSLYGGTRCFIDAAAVGFGEAGHEVEVLDLGVVEDPPAVLVAHAATCRPDLVFAIGITGEFRAEDGRTVSALYGARHIVWHVDYLLGQGPRIEKTPPSTGLMTIDPTHVDSVRAAYGPDAHPHMGFFPHPGVGEPATDDTDVDAFVAGRPIQLLWSGSFQKAERTWGQFSPIVQKTLNNATDLALSVEWIPPHEAVAKVLADLGIDVTEPARRIHLTLAGHVQDQVRKTRRTEFLKAVAKTGVPIHICGLGGGVPALPVQERHLRGRGGHEPDGRAHAADPDRAEHERELRRRLARAAVLGFPGRRRHVHGPQHLL